MKFILLISAQLILGTLAAQDIRSDLVLLNKQSQRNDPVDLSNEKKVFRPLSILYAGTLGFYQRQISPQWGANCAFEITCSSFSKQLVQEYGLFKGFFLTVDRLGRCNKLSLYETLPIRINEQQKIIDHVDFYQRKR